MKRVPSEHLTSQAAIARLNTLVEEQCRVISALEQRLTMQGGRILALELDRETLKESH
jgi:hypothetical protein